MIIKGQREVFRDLENKGQKIETKSQAALYSGGQMIANEASENCPVLTGNLKRSIHPELVNEDGTEVVYVGTDVEYAEPVEFGTSRQTAQPYLRPAFDKLEDDAVKEVDEALKKLL